MDPAIHYTRTGDGCAIAYTVIGAGTPIVYLQPYTNQQIDHHHPVIGPWCRRIARHHTLVRLDLRGFGLSERDPAKISLEGHVSDVEAVVERLGLDRFALVGVSGQGYTAVMYAARHPERVSQLVIWGTPATGYPNIRLSQLWAIPDLDSELVLDALARFIAGDDPGQISAWSDYVRATTDAEAARAYALQLQTRADITVELPAIRCPCLVVHPSLHATLSITHTRDLASRVPDCEFVVAESHFYPHLGPDTEANARIIERFLGHEDADVLEGDGDRQSTVATGFHTILFTDLESSTVLTQRLGDERAQEVVHGHNRVVRAALKEFGGREVKHTGDGIMADFPSAVGAVRAAVRIRSELAGAEVRARVGLNAGEPIEEDGDLFGTAVQLASRLCGYAEPGQIVVSNVVRELCAGKGLVFEPLGLADLKGFAEPVTVYTVAERG